MTDEMIPRAAAAADMALNIYALSGAVEREAMLGSVIACAAAHADKTPRQLLVGLVDVMPTDEEWTTDHAERTLRKCRNSTRWFKGLQIHYVGKGNQG